MKHKRKRGFWLCWFQASKYPHLAEELLQTKRALNRAMSECDKQETLVLRLRAMLRAANRSVSQASDRCELWRVAAEEWEAEARRQQTAASEWRQIADGRVAS